MKCKVKSKMLRFKTCAASENKDDIADTTRPWESITNYHFQTKIMNWSNIIHGMTNKSQFR